jgi:hypothetical protein
MPVLDDIAEGALKLLFHFFIEIVFFYTGECVLYVVTFGWKKPRWDYYSNESLPKWAVLTEISWWIGFFLWIFAIGLIARQLLK